MSIRPILIFVLVLVTLAGNVHADPRSTCTRAAGTQTCADGSVINQCDDCPGTNSSNNNNANGGGSHKMTIVGVVLAVALLGLLVLSLTWDPTKNSTSPRTLLVDGCMPPAQPGGLTFRF